MTLFVYTFSFVFLIRFNGYFTLPMLNRQSLYLTNSVSIDALTTELYLTRNEQTTSQLNTNVEHSTEQTINDKLNSNNSSFSTLKSVVDMRSESNFLLTTDESSTEVSQVKLRDFEDKTENTTETVQIETTTKHHVEKKKSHRIRPILSSTHTTESSSLSSTFNSDDLRTNQIQFEETTEYATTTNSPRSSTRIVPHISKNRTTTVKYVTISNKIPEVVTSVHPKKTLFLFKKISKEEEAASLNQSVTLLLFLLAGLFFLICVTASAFAFVKNRYTLKRKSRITEMEAHLDEHYLHYPHPFLFPHAY